MRLYHIIILFAALFLATYIQSQEIKETENSAKKIKSKMSEILRLPDGKFKGKIVHISPEKNQSIISFTGQKSNGEALYKFNTAERGLVLKVLFKNSGKIIWVYNVAGSELFKKIGNDRYDSILGTNFFFIDLFLDNLLSFYSASITDNVVYKDKDCFLLTLASNISSPYGSFDIYSEKASHLPLRIDFHDSGNIIFKSMTIVKTIGQGDKLIPVRFDMLDIKKESLTILEYTEFDKISEYDKEIFRYENLAKDL